MRERTESYTLDSFEVSDGSPTSRSEGCGEAALRRCLRAESSGDGPVDAIFSAILAAVDTEAELREYRVGAVTGGEDALAR